MVDENQPPEETLLGDEPSLGPCHHWDEVSVLQVSVLSPE